MDSSLGNYGNKLPSIEKREKNVNKMRIDKRENLQEREREEFKLWFIAKQQQQQEKKAKKSRSIRKIQSNR